MARTYEAKAMNWGNPKSAHRGAKKTPVKFTTIIKSTFVLLCELLILLSNTVTLIAAS